MKIIQEDSARIVVRDADGNWRSVILATALFIVGLSSLFGKEIQTGTIFIFLGVFSLLFLKMTSAAFDKTSQQLVITERSMAFLRKREKKYPLDQIIKIQLRSVRRKVMGGQGPRGLLLRYRREFSVVIERAGNVVLNPWHYAARASSPTYRRIGEQIGRFLNVQYEETIKASHNAP